MMVLASMQETQHVQTKIEHVQQSMKMYRKRANMFGLVQKDEPTCMDIERRVLKKVVGIFLFLGFHYNG